MGLIHKASAIPTTTTFYVEVPVRKGTVGAQISWPDAVSSATITMELTSNPDAAHADTSTANWKDSGITITGPAASAAGSALINVENVRQRRARFKVVTAAVTTLFFWDGTDA